MRNRIKDLKGEYVMKHIEVSRKICLGKMVETVHLKKALVERLERVIEIEEVSDGEEKFTLKGTTGTPASITRHAAVDFHVDIVNENKVARILISGYARTARSLMIFYSFFFLLFLLVGLLPGSIESGPDSDAIDVLVFLIFGIFIIFDTNRKLSEPKDFLEDALQSLDTEFG
jgi:hypothetical protein